VLDRANRVSQDMDRTLASMAGSELNQVMSGFDPLQHRLDTLIAAADRFDAAWLPALHRSRQAAQDFASFLASTDEALKQQELQLHFTTAALDEYRDRYQNQVFQEQVLALEQSLIQQHATMDFYQQAEALLVEKHLNDLSLQEEMNQQRTQAIWQSGWAGKAQIMTGILGSLSTLMQSESRKMFEIGKVAAISQTVISTYEGAQKAYTSLAGIPIVGPALGAAAAAAAIAAGVVRVQQIQSTSFGGASVTAAQSLTQIDAATGGTGGGPAAPTQELIIQGGFASTEALEEAFRLAAEENVQIVGVRGG
jgi:hypothetical protein